MFYKSMKCHSEGALLRMFNANNIKKWKVKVTVFKMQDLIDWLVQCIKWIIFHVYLKKIFNILFLLCYEKSPEEMVSRRNWIPSSDFRLRHRLVLRLHSQHGFLMNFRCLEVSTSGLFETPLHSIQPLQLYTHTANNSQMCFLCYCE